MVVVINGSCNNCNMKYNSDCCTSSCSSAEHDTSSFICSNDCVNNNDFHGGSVEFDESFNTSDESDLNISSICNSDSKNLLAFFLLLRIRLKQLKQILFEH